MYCGHEYSIQNLTFGLHVEPDNKAIQDKLKWCQAQREGEAEPTVPSTIAEEKLINPFMRVNQPNLRQLSGKESNIETMDFIRSLKDNFKAKK